MFILLSVCELFILFISPTIKDYLSLAAINNILVCNTAQRYFLSKDS